VTGIGLTADYIEARTPSAWVRPPTGSGPSMAACSVAVRERGFDSAYDACRHEHRRRDAAVRRGGQVLRPGAAFGIYDVMRCGRAIWNSRSLGGQRRDQCKSPLRRTIARRSKRAG
jgi:hypothetical protein